MDTERTDTERTENDLARLMRLAGARPAAPADAEARIRAAVYTRWRADLDGRRAGRRRLWVAGALAAAAAIVLAVVGLRGPAAPSNGGAPIATLTRIVGSLDGLTAGAAIPEGAGIETGPADRAALLLADGTSMRVDHDTTLRLLAGPVIELARGAVYLETGPHPHGTGALTIRTSLGTVRDIGTRFETRLRDGAIEVSVRAGLARLEHAGATRDAAAGVQLIAGQDGAVTSGSVPLHGSAWDWILQVAPAFSIEGRTLGEFLEWTARETGWQVRFTDPAIEAHALGTVLHGSIEGLRPDEAPAAVLPTCGLRQRLEGDTLLIESAEGGSP
jgi:ferric-dicitrate binding protein FerR (iron transport regulator)